MTVSLLRPKTDNSSSLQPIFFLHLDRLTETCRAVLFYTAHKGMLFLAGKSQNNTEMAQKNTEKTEKKAEIIEINSEKSPEVKRGKGRPKKDSVSSLSLSEESLFRRACDYKNKSGTDMTISGMARYLGYLDTRDMLEKAQKGDRGLRRALNLCEEKYERELTGKFSAGATIALKQLGWKETQYVQTEVKAVTVNVLLTETLDDLAKVLHPVEEQTVS